MDYSCPVVSVLRKRTSHVPRRIGVSWKEPIVSGDSPEGLKGN